MSNSLNLTALNTSGLKTAMDTRDPEMLKDLNIFWTQGTILNAGGHATRPSKLNGSTNEAFLYVVMLNQYNSYNMYNPTKEYQGHYATALTIAHEVGHNLDFAHTYIAVGAGAPAVCNTNNINYLDDVHGPVGNQNCPHNPIGGAWSCDSKALPADPLCTNNLMSGNFQSLYMSPKQIGIAQNSLRTTSLRQKINNCPYSSTPLEVTTNQTWDKDVFLYRDVIVKNQSVLTITCKLGLPETGRIIVEKGSKLVVDGGQISSSCKGKYWTGIVLKGDNSHNQMPMNNPTHQAKLELKNGAVLDNVMYAIRFGDDVSWNDFGGLVQAEDATIRCTRRAVQFMSYPFINNSYFKRCTLEYVTTIADLPLPLVTLWDTYGVNINGCTFQDNTGINEFDLYAGSGIFSIDAGYQVAADCNDPNQTSPCGSQYLTRSSFKNFNIGIQATSSGTDKTLTVTETDFEDNSQAVLIKAYDNIRFENNHILAGGLLKSGYFAYFSLQYGLNMYNSSGFEIENNVFETKNNPVYAVAGIRIAESGTEANEVYRNNFKNNYYGQYYFGRNRNKNQYEGLQFLCNTNNVISNHTDVQVEGRVGYSGSNFDGIRTYQGSTNPDMSAGNTFSTSPSSMHIDNASQQGIVYYYSAPAEAPTNYTPGLVMPIQIPNANGCPEQTINGVVSAPYYNLRNQYDALLYNYFQLIDNGNTDSLVQAINLTWNSDAEQLRNELMSQAPYLSEQALWEAAGTGI